MSTLSLKLKNVLNQQSDINQRLFQIANGHSELLPTISSLLLCNTEQIKAICTKNQVTPAALATPSRMAYSWMKFLTNEDNLNLHLDTLKRAIDLGNKIIATKRSSTQQIYIELCNSSSLYRGRKMPNLTTLSLNEGFIQADNEILQAVLSSILIAKNAKSQHIIRQFGVSEEYSDVLLELDLVAQIAAENPQGSYYNLDELFTTINQQYFACNMIKPRLMWSGTFSQRKFGHYERTRDRIVLSQTLDSQKVPRYIVEFVLYHELLHKQHGIQWVNGKRMVHTPEFKRSERKFEKFQEAEAGLQKLASARK
jgi:hypothetical protein